MTTALASLAPRFLCPECGTQSAAAASFCGWCRHPFGADLRPPSPPLDGEGLHRVEPRGGLLDCPDPWTWGGDGRTLYLFESIERGGKLAVRRIPLEGEAASPPAPLLAADAVRGLAVTRRGAFAAARSTIHAVLTPTAVSGEGRTVEIALPEGAEIIGFAGAGDRLFVACLDGGRLTLRSGSTAGVPPILAACAWPGGPPSWLRLYVDADLQTVAVWGGGFVGLADLSLGVLTLAAHPDAPKAEPLDILKRRGDAGAAQPMRPAGHPGVAPAPLEGGGWGLLDFATGTIAKPPADCMSPLAVVAAGRGAAVLRPGFLAHLELAGGALQERRIPIGPSAAAALSAGPEGALALISRPDGSLVVTEAHLAAGRPPAARAETELRRAGSGADAFPMLPPQVVDGRVWFAALASDQLLLWASQREGAA